MKARLFIALLFSMICGIYVYAAFDGYQSGTNFNPGENESVVTGSIEINPSGTSTGEFIIGFKDVALTSPTKTVNVNGATIVKVTTDVSQTGITLTGAESGQHVIVYGTSDSKTLRFDDNGSTLALGGNVTLGVDDILHLWTPDGTNFKRIGSSDN